MGKFVQKYTDEELEIEAKKYNSRGDFNKYSRGHYRTAYRRNLLDTICTHMTGGIIQWTEDMLQEEASKYTIRAEFQRHSPGGYSSALKRGILDDVCSHMRDGRTRRFPMEDKLKGIYILYDESTVVYVGKSKSCMYKRILWHIPLKSFTNFTAYEISSEADIDVAEVYLINKYQPKYNEECNSKTTLTLNIDNFDSILSKEHNHIL